MWCIPELTTEYVEKMEDVLDLYEKPLDKKEPVVCLDEKPVQLLQDARPSLPADKPGTIFKRDSEYVRSGTANVFCAVEPKAGRHITKVTKNRKGPQFAKIISRIAKAYPKARTIHLVVDNLNTHCGKSLTDFYGKKRGASIWNRFTIHYTPKHGSWLDQAEIEIGVFSRQCLGKDRIGDIQSLRSQASAWNRQANRRRLKIDWRFTVKDARKKFKYNFMDSMRSEH
ncbi:MAG: IS630 family transposase [Elusimicrobia bacterium]|nr:IS630 family transposase [Elusimicrobiota bacterium]